MRSLTARCWCRVAAAKRDARWARQIDPAEHRAAASTDLLLTETWQLLKAKFGKDVADTFWERLRDSGARVEPVVRADLDAASEIDARFPDESFSLIDRTSFALMERLGPPEPQRQPGLRRIPSPPRSRATFPDTERRPQRGLHGAPGGAPRTSARAREQWRPAPDGLSTHIHIRPRRRGGARAPPFL